MHLTHVWTTLYIEMLQNLPHFTLIHNGTCVEFEYLHESNKDKNRWMS